MLKSINEKNSYIIMNVNIFYFCCACVLQQEDKDLFFIARRVAIDLGIPTLLVYTYGLLFDVLLL